MIENIEQLALYGAETIVGATHRAMKEEISEEALLERLAALSEKTPPELNARILLILAFNYLAEAEENHRANCERDHSNGDPDFI